MTTSQAGEEALFNAARQIADGVARAEYLREAAGGDEALLRRVGALLAVYDIPDRLLDQPAAAAVPTEALDSMRRAEPAAVISAESAGSQIGPYKLLAADRRRRDGHGLHGRADRAGPAQGRPQGHQGRDGQPPGHRPLRGRAAGPGHDGPRPTSPASSTPAPPESGRPYFVMELVHGVPITRYCDDNRLTPRQRLELFVPVCQAIQHAHQKGIIHRDIKPSNVMVTLYDGKPVPKVIDFGVAKATEQTLTERTLFTQHGTLVGTLEYMSPEQAEMSALGVDTRSDIYSLGVLLYELLTGSTPLSRERVQRGGVCRGPPHDQGGRAAQAEHAAGRLGRGAWRRSRRKRHTEPARLTRLVRGELDWIVMKSAGEGPRPPLRDGQRLRRRRAAVPGRRAGAGMSAVGLVSPAEVRPAEPAA